MAIASHTGADNSSIRSARLTSNRRLGRESMGTGAAGGTRAAARAWSETANTGGDGVWTAICVPRVSEVSCELSAVRSQEGKRLQHQRLVTRSNPQRALSPSGLMKEL